ncbi:unnamed protein product [Moneuplotes crassus]|uniref:Uncharacterized protein n=1 Tax=Euplotes crassus TaxID=5936 RepID=A0AAD2D4S6_EUPCR|nr:unnamed protein product [Moneuplotes crassus]
MGSATCCERRDLKLSTIEDPPEYSTRAQIRTTSLGNSESTQRQHEKHCGSCTCHLDQSEEYPKKRESKGNKRKFSMNTKDDEDITQLYNTQNTVKIPKILDEIASISSEGSNKNDIEKSNTKFSVRTSDLVMKKKAKTFYNAKRSKKALLSDYSDEFIKEFALLRAEVKSNRPQRVVSTTNTRRKKQLNRNSNKKIVSFKDF